MGYEGALSRHACPFTNRVVTQHFPRLKASMALVAAPPGKPRHSLMGRWVVVVVARKGGR